MSLINYLKKNTWIFILIALLIVAGVSHAYNMFNYPYYENDEGAYMSQAWAIVKLGKLSPYTYWYDHAPAGWILISAWGKIVGFFTFGVSVNSGRVLMLVIHLFTAGLLFYVANKLSKTYLAGIIAVIIFSLSPLAIYFQRRVLLDNIMIFWIFLSLALLLVDKLKLRHIILSSIAFAISVLTKENAIFFLPAFLYVLYVNTHKYHKLLAITKWLVISGIVISLYFLYALLKNEFFPVGFMGDSTPHVSLITTMREQLGRGSGSLFWNQQSDFYVNFNEWIKKDYYVLLIGIVSTAINIAICLKKPSYRIAILFLMMMWVFLIRGGLVIDFYIIPLVPLMALNIGLTIDFFLRFFSFKNKYTYNFMSLLAIVAISGLFLLYSKGQYTQNETKPQVDALKWMFNNIPKDSVVAVDAFAEVDYREKGYKNAIWFWKIWDDPEEQKKFDNSWQNIDYVFLTHEMLKQIPLRTDRPDILREAILGSSSLKFFGPENKGTLVSVPDFRSTNGDWAAIYKLKQKNKLTLDKSGDYYDQNFIVSYGQVVDPAKDTTTSEGQSYAMLKAVMQNEKTRFEGVWSWTRDHLQYRKNDKLFSWLWGKENGKEQVLDSGHAADADQDIALSLIFAGRRWDEPKYTAEAKKILSDLWKTSVVNIGGRYYMYAGSGFEHPTGYVINPSYLSPAHYRIFAQIDNNHPWVKLADDSYYLLNRISDKSGNTSKLPSNWIFVSKSGEISSAKLYVGQDADKYGFDAFRTFWRVALDYQWFKSEKAFEYLSKSSKFFRDEWNKNKYFKAVYLQNGQPDVSYESLANSAGALSVLYITNSDLAKEVYEKVFNSKFNLEQGYWGEKNNYYDQNWAWFVTALYTNSLPNLIEN